ncbi:hypothetical protein PENTCL1PPCAC_21627 [Pristionchus entomophagus]|uniref:G protein-coupled receptor n=1 Tax=Pristionchus entomophagus TaxID=358040 RepID=A0AAV5TZB4_9BILA|nr:hypothetical protein PENTCL1PPCAC_21627 [Pristionchus entomophagus]
MRRLLLAFAILENNVQLYTTDIYCTTQVIPVIPNDGCINFLKMGCLIRSVRLLTVGLTLR